MSAQSSVKPTEPFLLVILFGAEEGGEEEGTKTSCGRWASLSVSNCHVSLCLLPLPWALCSS